MAGDQESRGKDKVEREGPEVIQKSKNNRDRSIKMRGYGEGRGSMTSRRGVKWQESHIASIHQSEIKPSACT